MHPKIKKALESHDPIEALESLFASPFGKTEEHADHLLKVLALDMALDSTMTPDRNLTPRKRIYAIGSNCPHKGFAALKLSIDYGDKYRTTIIGIAWIPGREAWPTGWYITHDYLPEERRVQSFVARQLRLWQLTGERKGFDLAGELKEAGRTTKAMDITPILAGLHGKPIK